MRRCEVGVSTDAEVAPALVVREDDDDVGLPSGESRKKEA